jgi:hypothetical protein
MEHRWLTLDMMASLLRVSPSYVKTLTKEGFLVTIGKADRTRWLDPGPAYAEKLRLAAVMHGDRMHVPPDICEIALLSLREVSVLCGWTLAYARWYMKTHKDIPRFNINPRLSLYSIKTVREILWRRQGRLHCKQRSPFLIQELIDWVKAEHEKELQDIPTDAEYAADDKMMRKLMKIVEKDARDQASAKNDLATKIELAKRIVQILESAKQ